MYIVPNGKNSILPTLEAIEKKNREKSNDLERQKLLSQKIEEDHLKQREEFEKKDREKIERFKRENPELYEQFSKVAENNCQKRGIMRNDDRFEGSFTFELMKLILDYFK